MDDQQLDAIIQKYKLAPPTTGSGLLQRDNQLSGRALLDSLKTKEPAKKPGLLRTIGGALISSEKNLSNTLAGGAAVMGKDYQAAQQSQTALDDMNVKLGEAISAGKKQGKDTSRLESLYQENTKQVFNPSEITAGAIDKTPLQVAGEVGGVGLDIATAGTLAKGATSFKMFGAAEKAAMAEKAKKGISLSKAIAENIDGTYKATTGAKVLDVAKTAAPSIAKGAAIGYGYDVTQGLQEGQGLEEAAMPGLGTVIGATIPGGLAAKRAMGVITKETAPTIINSLVKPLLKDFSYGKNPGRAVAQEGIIANNLDDLADQISKRRATIGQEIGQSMQNLQGKAQLSVENAFEPINTAMNSAAKTNNPTLLKRLQAVKEALTSHLELGTDELGNPTIVNNGEKALNNLNFDEAFKIKTDIGDLTQWTGNASDDKLVNSALKQVYGNVKNTINETAMRVDKATGQRLEVLNEKYADLTSAEVATKYRDKIESRQNILSLGNKLATVGAVTTAIMTGQGGLGTILMGVGGAVLDKALSSTAVKTRLAKWMAGEAPGTLERIFNSNPKVRDAIYGAFTKDATEDTKTLIQKANEWVSKRAGLTIEDVSKTPGFKSPAVGETALIQEAKKYKSAEEFVKKQPVAYHGSREPLKKFSNKKGGVFFTSEYTDATGYSGGLENVYEGYLNFKKPLEIDAKGAKWDKLNTKYGKSTQEVISNAKKDGYDGVIFKNIVDNVMDTEGMGESTVYYAYKPHDAFIDESQLTDIWNKAHKK